LYFVDWTVKPKTSEGSGSTKPDPTKTPKGKTKGKAKKDSAAPVKEAHRDSSFREFRRLCAVLSDTDSYTEKTALVRKLFMEGTDGCEYRYTLLIYKIPDYSVTRWQPR
jgi:DNA ligase-3